MCDWVYPKKTDFAFGRADHRPSIKFSTWDFGGQVRVGRVFVQGGVGGDTERLSDCKLVNYYQLKRELSESYLTQTNILF